MSEPLKRAHLEVATARALDREGEIAASTSALLRALEAYRAHLGENASDALAKLGASARAVARVREVEAAVASFAPERASLRERAKLRDALDRAADDLEEASIALALGPARARRRRVARALLSGLFLTACAAYVAFALGVRPFASVTASGVFFDDPTFDGEKAFDGRVETEWLLPDRAEGTLDLRLFPSRDLRAVTLVNGHNRAYADRAVQRFTVELYRDGARIHEQPGSFRALTTPGERVTLRFPRTIEDVDRVRIHVRSSFRLGGALAEVELH